ncbi:indolepyruvate ferredoxin oxidoreductase family protein [Hyphomonas sp. CY54-11-8]|uniref:indolepyruvate ferredoxin oxidoreductase family protein n=1 Tax=Hyphomonas sp. CY54-11-8 TaxID=1280944 RepID=UPI0009DED7C2|nr:indolepyruvate ferredoxin oxidoreductase family protein [Hyphomonas sp. CY54-11-8]
MPYSGSSADLRSERFESHDVSILTSGVDSLVRMLLERARLDQAKGWRTGGFVSGYRGSPLATFDMKLENEAQRLSRAGIEVLPAINEDLGATAVWGSQQVGLFSGAQVEGVFGLWYGKAPGVDRSGDAFKHANYAGVSRKGGVLAIAGDDHGAKSSSLPAQSEYNFIDAEIPVLAPSTIREVLEYGVKAFDLSRYSGLWSAMTVVAELMDSTANLTVDAGMFATNYPDYPFSGDPDLWIREKDTPLQQEERVRLKRLPAALAFARANSFDQTLLEAPHARFCLVTQGKAYRDVTQALSDLGITADVAKSLGLRIYKPGLVWPLEPQRALDAIRGTQSVLVVEERRSLVESQLRKVGYGLKDSQRPALLGKFDDEGRPLISEFGELSADDVARAIGKWLPESLHTEQMRSHLARIKVAPSNTPALASRAPFYCPGCPHNSSTVVPEGSRASAGIGCHYLVQYMPRQTSTFTQMGAEGITWVGQAPFTSEKHIFTNLGDGTYFHSGILAIRQAVAAKVNITYKVLFNDAVAMTGGQSVDGPLSPAAMAAQIAAEGVSELVVVSDDPASHETATGFPSGVNFYDRSELDTVQKRLRDVPGTTVIIYVQTCATELRRKRKRGLTADPSKKIFINERVCEGCGDCSAKSNCMAVEPVETDFGQKRRIDQSACNVDAACTDGFCPSFVTLEGAELAPPKKKDATPSADLAAPSLTKLTGDSVFNLVLAGVGGQGITSLSAMLCMAGHFEGLAVNAVDALGMAQKGGGVYSHIRMSPSPEAVVSARVGSGGADTVLTNDIVLAHSETILPLMSADKTRVVANHRILPTADMIGARDARHERASMQRQIETNSSSFTVLDADRVVREELGDPIFANMCLLGSAWQRGHIPIGLASIVRAMEEVGVKVKQNRRAFELGRQMALDEGWASVKTISRKPLSIDELIDKRTAELVAYQDRAYAERFRAALRPLQTANAQAEGDFVRIAAENLFKLMAYKDEYEVARLYASDEYRQTLRSNFSGRYKVRLHMAPPLIARKKEDGTLQKMKLPSFFFKLMPLLAAGKRLRGSWADPFGWTEERKMERALRDEYIEQIARLAGNLSQVNEDAARRLLAAPRLIRGYGHIKAASVEDYKVEVREAETGLVSQCGTPKKTRLIARG